MFSGDSRNVVGNIVGELGAAFPDEVRITASPTEADKITATFPEEVVSTAISPEVVFTTGREEGSMFHGPKPVDTEVPELPALSFSALSPLQPPEPSWSFPSAVRQGSWSSDSSLVNPSGTALALHQGSWSSGAFMVRPSATALAVSWDSSSAEPRLICLGFSCVNFVPFLQYLGVLVSLGVVFGLCFMLVCFCLIFDFPP